MKFLNLGSGSPTSRLGLSSIKNTYTGREVKASGGVVNDTGVCSGCSFTSMAEKYLHYLGVGQGGEVTQVAVITRNLPEDSPHDLP